MNVLIWGIGNEFHQLYHLLTINEIAGYFQIVGYVSKDRTKKQLDGKDVLVPEEIVNSRVAFDYIIVTTNIYFKEIVDYGNNILRIERKKFINGKVFKLPNFSWNKYMQIYNSNISIISENCTGGVLSNALGLPFCSPFVKVRIGIEKMDYFRLISKLDYYMKQSPKEFTDGKYKDINWNGWEGRVDFPRLWYDDILIHGFHYQSQKELLDTWENRRKRYNSQNKLVIKVLYEEEDVERFEQLECNKKLGIYHKKVQSDNIITIPCIKEDICDMYSYSYATYIFDIVNNGIIFSYIDIFELLGGGYLNSRLILIKKYLYLLQLMRYIFDVWIHSLEFTQRY